MDRKNLIKLNDLCAAVGVWIKTRPIVPAALAGIAIFWFLGVTFSPA